MSNQIPRTASRVLDDVDDYAQTLEALVALSHIVVSRYVGNAWISRKMRLDDNGTAGREISPDLTVTITNYALIAEAKQSLPRDQKFWNTLLEQVKKYDGKMYGWPPHGGAHDVSLMCNQLISVGSARYISQAIGNGTLNITNAHSIIAYNRNTHRRIFIFLKKEAGALSHPLLEEALTTGVSVDLENVLKELSSVRFYDSEPPDVHTMSLLWLHVFPRLVGRKRLKNPKAPEVEVAVPELTEELRTYFAPPGNRDVVRIQWVRRAMRSFVRIGLARPKSEYDRYLVTMKKFSGTALDYFAKNLYQEDQLKLDSFSKQVTNDT